MTQRPDRDVLEAACMTVACVRPLLTSQLLRESVSFMWQFVHKRQHILKLSNK